MSIHSSVRHAESEPKRRKNESPGISADEKEIGTQSESVSCSSAVRNPLKNKQRSASPKDKQTGSKAKPKVISVVEDAPDNFEGTDDDSSKLSPYFGGLQLYIGAFGHI